MHTSTTRPPRSTSRCPLRPEHHARNRVDDGARAPARRAPPARVAGHGHVPPVLVPAAEQNAAGAPRPPHGAREESAAHRERHEHEHAHDNHEHHRHEPRAGHPVLVRETQPDGDDVLARAVGVVVHVVHGDEVRPGGEVAGADLELRAALEALRRAQHVVRVQQVGDLAAAQQQHGVPPRVAERDHDAGGGGVGVNLEPHVRPGPGASVPETPRRRTWPQSSSRACPRTRRPRTVSARARPDGRRAHRRRRRRRPARRAVVAPHAIGHSGGFPAPSPSPRRTPPWRSR